LLSINESCKIVLSKEILLKQSYKKLSQIQWFTWTVILHIVQFR
jgi:hypothetical protein